MWGVSPDRGVPLRVLRGDLTDCRETCTAWSGGGIEPEQNDPREGVHVGDTKAAGRDSRTAAQIEADIVRTRAQLAATLDELAVAVHPSTLIGQAKDHARASVDRTVGRGYVAVNRGVERVRSQFVDEQGSLRKERVVPVAGAVVVVVAGIVLVRRRK